jgi:hypothetical protein
MGGLSTSKRFEAQVATVGMTEWAPEKDDYAVQFVINNVNANETQHYLFTTNWRMLPGFARIRKSAYFRHTEFLFGDPQTFLTLIPRRVDGFEGSAWLRSYTTNQTYDPTYHTFLLSMFPSQPGETLRFEVNFKVGLAPIDAYGCVIRTGGVLTD